MSGLRRFQVTALFLAAVFLLPGIAGAVTEEDFKVMSTQDIIDLCTVSPGDPFYEEAINFCHGFLVGAYHYHEAQAKGPEGRRLVCPPDPPPSRNETINEFIKWALDHPEYMGEEAVETEFRFLMQKWPCNR
jgi:hypothetical protein